MSETTRSDGPAVSDDAAPLARIDRFVRIAHGHRGPASTPMRRIVVRIDAKTVAKIDSLRSRWPKATRAALVRAFCLFGLVAADDAEAGEP
jgi:hypothetical protein